MRLGRYIHEERDEWTVINETIDTLKRDCGPFLKDLSKAGRGEKIFRGIKRALKTGSDTAVEKFKPRKDRWPSDVPQDIHEYVDKDFKDKFGWKPRSEGVFTSASYMTAANFGIPMFFFPIGKYRYIWAKGIGDFIGALDRAGVIHYSGGKWRTDKSWDKETREDRIDDILDGYTNKNLEKAITNNEEIIFNCKAYYLIDRSWQRLLRKLDEEIWK